MALSLEELVKHYDRPGPRYTGYPMPPVWSDGFPETQVIDALARAESDPAPFSLYAHLPFCKRRCSYCGCNVVVSPTYAPVEQFLQSLEAEVDLWAAQLPTRRKAIQLHWGGGTPTYLKVPELARTFKLITDRFPLLPGAEVSIEVDPTFLAPDQLPALRELGFNRVSFGVQDLDEGVQALITRGQTWEQTLGTVKQARSLGFPGVEALLPHRRHGVAGVAGARAIIVLDEFGQGKGHRSRPPDSCSQKVGDRPGHISRGPTLSRHRSRRPPRRGRFRAGARGPG